MPEHPSPLLWTQCHLTTSSSVTPRGLAALPDQEGPGWEQQDLCGRDFGQAGKARRNSGGKGWGYDVLQLQYLALNHRTTIRGRPSPGGQGTQ